MGSLISELQADAIDPKISVGVLFRKAKIAAVKLKVASEFISWLDLELDGYPTSKNTPKYRELRGVPEFLHPIYGWRPITFTSADTYNYYSKAIMLQSCISLEELLSRDISGILTYNYEGGRRERLIKNMSDGIACDVRIRLGASSISDAVNTVRNTVMNWALELDGAGVLGEGLKFSDRDQREASSVTHHYVAQNLTVMGNVGNGAQVTTTQTVTQAPLDLNQVAELLKELRVDIARLSEEDREVAEANVAMAEAELAKDEPREGKVRAALKALAPTMGNLTVGVAGSAAWDAIKKMIGIG